MVIGSNTLSDSRRKGSPTIGNNVFIGASATVIGNVRIGNNCRIGSNCVVTCDIPDNSLVVMDKPRIITKLNMNNKFYTQTEEGCWRYNNNGEKIIETDKNCINDLHEIDVEWEIKKTSQIVEFISRIFGACVADIRIFLKSSSYSSLIKSG